MFGKTCPQRACPNTGLRRRSISVIETQHGCSVYRPLSPGPSLPFQSGVKHVKGENLKSLLSPLPHDIRRHSDSSVVPSYEKHGEDNIAAEAWRTLYSVNPALLKAHQSCQSCLSHLLQIHTENSAHYPPFTNSGNASSTTGLRPKGVHRGSLSEKSDLSDLNKSLQNIIGHDYDPKPTFLCVPSIVVESDPYRSVRSHGDESEIMAPKPPRTRRASVCIGDHAVINWVGCALYYLWPH